MNRGPHLCSRRPANAAGPHDMIYRMQPVTGKECSRWPANAQSAWNDVSRWPANYKTSRQPANAAGDRRMTGEMTWFGFLATHKEKKWSRQQLFKNWRSSKHRSPYPTKETWSNYFQPWVSFLTTFSRPPFFAISTNSAILSATSFKFVAGCRFFHLIENANILKQNNFLLRMQPVTGKCTICMKWVSRWPANYKTIAGNRRMQPVTCEITWSGFLATHKENIRRTKMVASTIF